MPSSQSSSPSSSSSFPSWFVIKLTALASLGGCLFGYDMGAISGALPQLTKQYGLSINEQGWVVSILFFGGGFGALIGGTICDQMGRLTTILITDFLFLIGAAWFIWVANSFSSLLIGRFLVGIAIAISGVADVAYLQEIAPQAWRGAIVSVNEACISLGFLLAFLAGYVYSDGETEGWRYIFGMAGVLAFLQGIGMWNMPESPVWLAGQGRIEESENVYRILESGDTTTITTKKTESSHNDDDIGNPMMMMTTTGSLSTPLASYQSSPPRKGPSSLRSSFSTTANMESMMMMMMKDDTSWSTMIYSLRTAFSKYFRQAWIAFFLAVTQQFCGQGVVLNYAPAILGDDSPTWSTLVVGGIKFLVTVLVIYKIESVGRRSLLLWGMGLITVGLLLLSVSPNNTILVLPGILAVVCGYSMSFGPLTWLLTAELFPSDIRGRTLGISTIVTYCAAAIVTRTFLPISEWLGYSFVFGGYASICMMGIIFAYLAIPETGDRSMEQIESALEHMSFWGRSPKKDEEGDIITTTMTTTNTNPNPISTFELGMTSRSSSYRDDRQPSSSTSPKAPLQQSRFFV